MENVLYNVKENGKKEKICDSEFVESLMNNMNEEYSNMNVYDDYNNDMIDYNLVNENNYTAYELEYQENYTVKGLIKILDYYNLPKRNMKKRNMIDSILIYESEIENIEIIIKRRTMWYYIRELKEDDYLKQFIIIDI